MTRWIKLEERGPTEKDMRWSNRRGNAVFIVCTRDGMVGEWTCRMSPMGGIYGGLWECAWMVPLDWCGDAQVTHWRRMPRPPGEFLSRVKWWFRKWRV